MMSCAFLGFMTPATSAFEVLSACSPRAANKNVHSILQTAAIICIVAAYTVIWDCHTVLSDTGLAGSMHSVVVFTTVFVSFSIVKFEDKKDVAAHKYTSIPNAAEDEVVR